MSKIDDHLRLETANEFLRGNSTQEEFCRAFQARTGRALAPRTLRSWISRLSAHRPSALRTRSQLGDALTQAKDLVVRLQAALDQLDGEAAEPVPDRHATGHNEGGPQAATTARPTLEATAALTLHREAAAGEPLGIEEDTTTEGPVRRFNWDVD